MNQDPSGNSEPGLYVCPSCNKRSLFWDANAGLYKCLNPQCKRRLTETEFKSINQEKPVSFSNSGERAVTGKSHQARFIIVLLIAILGIAASVFLSVQLNTTGNILSLTESELSITREKLATTESTLLSTTNELALTRDKLSTTQSELSSTQNKLTSTREELTTTTNELTSTRDKLAANQSELSSTQNKLTSTYDELQFTQTELKQTENELALYKDTYGSVVASDVRPRFTTFSEGDMVNVKEAKNPTWAELVSFLLSETTDLKPYIPDVYMCGEFARDVHNNAEKAGIRSAWVAIKFPDAYHACNAFKTTDRGLVFIDCTGTLGTNGPSNYDTIVDVRLGQSYIPVFIFSTNWRCGNMGTILDVQVYW